MRLSDARLRCRQTKLFYPNHRLPPWLAEDATPRSLEPMVRHHGKKEKSMSLAVSWICISLHHSLALRDHRGSPALPPGQSPRRMDRRRHVSSANCFESPPRARTIGGTELNPALICSFQRCARDLCKTRDINPEMEDESPRSVDCCNLRHTAATLLEPHIATSTPGA
jgi:hypothetical protein